MSKEQFRVYLDKDLIKKVRIQIILDEKPLTKWVAEAFESKLKDV